LWGDTNRFTPASGTVPHAALWVCRAPVRRLARTIRGVGAKKPQKNEATNPEITVDCRKSFCARGVELAHDGRRG